MSYLHFMSRFYDGWLSPAESSNSHGGVFVLPIDDFGKFEKEYKVDIQKYLGNGEWDKIETLNMLRDGENHLTLTVEKHPIVFERKEYIFPYTGHFVHPDFKFLLVEVKPDQDSIDRLLSDTGYVVIGCSPWTNYKAKY